MAKRIPLIAILILLGSSCATSPHSPSGFRLPPNGDAVRGKAAFVAFGCHSCHPVLGSDLNKPAAQSAVSVALGGAVDRQMTDGYLVTSIIYPTYALASYPKEQITRDGQSRMTHYADKMTVQQLTDIVTFLQSHYTLRQALPEYGAR